MEIRKGYETIAKFPVPSSVLTAFYTVQKDGVELGVRSNATVSNGVATVTIPYAAVAAECEVTVSLTFYQQGKPYTADRSFQVVTPYLELWELRELADDVAMTDNDLWNLEAAVRYIVNAHTGQTFGYYHATYPVPGVTGDYIALPARLVNLTSFNGVSNFTDYKITGDGWYLSALPLSIPPVRADYYGLHMLRNGIVENPNMVNLAQFKANYPYVIEGDWGWKQVPEAVREATKLLVNDYADPDTLYRDRYLSSMTAADWRIQFQAGAYTRTGNVRADQLLSDFVTMRGWTVI